jgi:hypothetical protein
MLCTSVGCVQSSVVVLWVASFLLRSEAWDHHLLALFTEIVAASKMIDPVSAASLAVELTAICAKAVKMIKNAIESMNKVREDLRELLNRIEGMWNILVLLRNLLRELLDTLYKDIEIHLNEYACCQTMKELESLADRIARTKLSSSILASVQWLHYQAKAKELIQKLRDQEAEVVNTMVLIGV